MSAPVGLRQTETKVMKTITNSWKKQEPVLVLQLNEKETIKHQTFMAERTINFPMTTKQLLAISPKRLVVHTFNFNQGYLLLVGSELLTQEQQNMLIRFAKVFEMTYRRFLDLQKAEKQAREAQIEVALERIRAKTMAMHNSEDVGHTVISLFDEVMKLGLDKSIRCGIGILENRDQMETWSANLKPNGEVDLRVGLLNMEIHPMLQGLKKAWNKGKDNYSYDFLGKDVYQYYHV